MTEKTCTRCGETKPMAEFRIADAADYMCKVCNRKAASAWRKQNPGRNAAACREWYYRNQRRVRDFTLQKNYGMTIDEYESMAERQNGVCAICLGQSKDGILRVDHDHQTGVVRGLLCDTCNRSLGLLGDSSEILRKAADYLDMHLVKRKEVA